MPRGPKSKYPPPFASNNTFPHPDAIKIDENGCWLWQCGLNAQGYGIVRIFNKAHLAHRISHYANIGPIKGIVCHKCNVKRCINPVHLYDGTPYENSLYAALNGKYRCPGCELHSNDWDRILRHMQRCKPFQAIALRQEGNKILQQLGLV